MQFKGKLMKRTWENYEKPTRLPLIWAPKIVFVGFTSTIDIALSNFQENQWAKLEKITKNLSSGPILARLAQIWVPHFFFVRFISTRC